MPKLMLNALLLVAVLAPAIAQSAPTPAQLCESAVELASAKYSQCRLTADSKYSKTGDATKRTAALAKCSQKLSDAFSRATLRYGAPNCTGSPSTGYDAYLSQCSDDVAAAAAAGGALPSCGNGTIDVVGEQCDGADLGGETCASLGFPGGGVLGCTSGCTLDTSACQPSLCGNGVIDGTEQCDGAALGGATRTNLGYTSGGTLGCGSGCGYDTSACRSQSFLATGQKTCWDTAGSVVPCAGTGQDGDLQRGASLSYVDNGDGTISDPHTALMWEKQGAGIGQYTWAGAFIRIADINSGAGLAGYTDWRLPNLRELESLRDSEHYSPAAAPAFNSGCVAGCGALTCSCTASVYYWSSSTNAEDPQDAWVVDFQRGSTINLRKTIGAMAVRAVRGGW